MNGLRQALAIYLTLCALALGCVTAQAGGVGSVTAVVQQELKQIGLLDSALTGATDGQVATWDSAQGKWVPEAAAGLDGFTNTTSGQLAADTGKGAITHLVGPTDQPFKIFAGTGRPLWLEGVGGYVYIAARNSAQVDLVGAYHALWNEGETNAVRVGFDADGGAISMDGAGVVDIESPGAFSGSIKGTTGNPASPVEGQLTINTTDGAVRIYAGGAWRDLATWTP